MAASCTITVAAGSLANAVANQAMEYWATITNTGANAATLNAVSASCNSPGVYIAQPDFLTPNVAPGLGNPVLPALTGTALVRFSVVFNAPNTSGGSPQQPSQSLTGTTGVAAQPAFPVSGFYNLVVQAQITDSAGSVAIGVVNLGVGVLSEMQNVPRAEGGALDFRQGSNILGAFPGWP